MSTNAAVGILAVKKIAEHVASDIYESTKLGVKKTAKSIVSQMEVGFSSYMNANYEKYSKVKTIVNRYQPVELSEIYEDCRLLRDVGEDFIDEYEIFEDKKKFRRLIISGTAGSGKSFFMKRSFLRHCEINFGTLPVFLEFRMLNSESSPDLKSFIVSSITPHLEIFDNEMVETLLKSGRVVIFFDGYDELFSSHKKKISKQIERISYHYPNVMMIISGRPDERFSSWAEFEELRIQPLNKQKCLNLIKKSVCPDEIRSRFYENVRNNLFKTHYEYLKNPLMVYVMLLTSDQFVDFPSDIGAFYAKAFETLFRGHDVMKSGEFQRDVNCEILLRELEDIFGYFCALSFRDQKYAFNEKLADFYLSNAIKLCQKEYSSSLLMEDINKNYCMMLLDDGKYNFIHRTFQEYFAAKCLSSTELLDYYAYNTNLIKRDFEFTRYFAILREVGAERFEKRFLYVILSSLIEKAFLIRSRRPKFFLSQFVGRFGLLENGELRMIAPGENRVWFALLIELLPSLYPRRFASVFDISEDLEAIRRFKFANEPERGVNVFHVNDLTNSQIKETNIYRYIKKYVEDIRTIKEEFEKRDVALSKIVKKKSRGNT